MTSNRCALTHCYYTGPSGIVGTNKWDAQHVVSIMEQQVVSRAGEAKPGMDASSSTVTKSDWLLLDAEERRRGEAAGKTRVKFSAQEALEFLQK